MTIEILCNGIVHYRRPSMEHPDVKEVELILDQQKTKGIIPVYEIREV